MLPGSGWLRSGYLRVKPRNRVMRPLRCLDKHLSWPGSSSPTVIGPASTRAITGWRNLGNVRSVNEGVLEYKIDFGPGYGSISRAKGRHCSSC